jgi:hypothetical protein
MMCAEPCKSLREIAPPVTLLLRCLAMLLICLGQLYAADTNSVGDTKGAILAIEKSVYDLTDQTVLLRCDAFLALRRSVTEAKASEIVCLIQSQELKGDAACIGIMAAQFLPEERYWAVTMPLVSSHTEGLVLQDMLEPALPYGPGYAHCITNAACKRKLTALNNDPEINGNIKGIIDRILSGEEKKIYAKFKRDPEDFNYPRKFLEPGK